MAIVTKEVVLVEDLIKAINSLPNCPNGYSDVFSKNRILHMAKTVPSQYADVEVNLESEIDEYE